MIYPQSSTFYFFWSIILFICLIYVAIFLPYFTAFYLADEYAEIDRIIVIIIDFIFLFDIFVAFNTAFMDKKGKYIDERCQIAKNYLKFWFWLDVLTILPISWIVDNTFSGYPKIIKLARFYKINRIAKIGKISRIFEKKNKGETSLSDIFGKMQELFYYFFIVVLFCHFSACLFYQVKNIIYD